MIGAFSPRAGAFAAAVALLLLAAPPASAGARSSSHRASPGHGTAAFWTQRRVARAISANPHPVADRPAAAPRGVAAPFLSEPVLDPGAVPYPANGLVLFRLDRRLYGCSAAIVDAPSARLVFTAAHCVRDPGPSGRFASKWAFVPDYDGGARPYGVWPASELWVAPGWVTRRSSEKADFGAAVIKRKGGVGVQSVTGAAYQLAINQPPAQTWEAIGYPGDPAFDDQMWHCVSPYLRTDLAQPRRPGPPPIGIGCDETEGVSGGPWISQSGTLGAISTYGYAGEPDVLFGTYLGSQAEALYDRVKDR